MIRIATYTDTVRACPKPEKREPKAKKPIPKVSDKRQGGSGELILFKAIWSTRPHRCEVTKKVIKDFDIRCFMHVLSKGAYPAFRLLDKNILLVTPEIHNEYDNGDRSAPLFDNVRLLHDELETLYHQ